jgi:hypothetical protein
MFGSFLPSLWSLSNHSLLGSRSRHCYAIKWRKLSENRGAVSLEEAITFGAVIKILGSFFLRHSRRVWASARSSPGPCGVACVLVLLLSWPLCCRAYSVLAHEAIVDSAWDTNIKPILRKRFPNATPDELRQAHGYAYGGAIIQDLGYYPHGGVCVARLLGTRASEDRRRESLHAGTRQFRSG